MGTVRVLMTFSRDGLLPELFKEVNPSTGMPLKNCFAVFIILSVLAFF
jgi:amino acid transporter